MKMKKSLYLAFAAMSFTGTAVLTGCQADMDAPAFEAPVATIQANTTIAELKTAFADRTEMIGLKNEETGEHYIVHGRVISSDASGNIYKSLVLQDETAALAFSINQANLGVMYPVGQDVVVDVTGLYIGYYRQLQQVGWLSDPYDGTPQLGFMALDYFRTHAQLNGFPNPEVKVINYGDPRPSDAMYMTVAEISKLPSAGEELRNMQSQLVEFRNVHFKGAGVQKFSVYQESGVNDTIVQNGVELMARTSGYCNFYNDVLPEGTGYVRGILSYYGTSTGSYQLMFRDRADVNVTTKGTTKEDAFTVAEVLSGAYTGLTGWTKGYIVGSVKAGVTEVKGNDDIIFGKDAEMDNNLVIAASPDETDWTKCLAVELPQGTPFRVYGNLADNPDVYKKELTVEGTLGTYLGMAGVTGNAGSFASFDIPGVTEGGTVATPEAKGNGTLDNPYNLGALLRAEQPMTDVWVEGYVAGYVAGSDFKNTAVWSKDDDGSSNFANNANIILSESEPGRANIGNSAPVQVITKFKPVLGLKNNPSIFGKKVKIRGDIDLDWLGSKSLRRIKEVVEQ